MVVVFGLVFLCSAVTYLWLRLVGCLRYCFVVFVLLPVLRGLRLALGCCMFPLSLFGLGFRGLVFGALLGVCWVFGVVWVGYDVRGG